jgi:hypothetical protein
METLPAKTSSNNALLVPIASPAELLTARSRLEEIIKKNLVENVDYGIIQGTKIPTLYKPGAEKINAAFGCYPQFLIVEKEINHDRENTFSSRNGRGTSQGLYRYVIECILIAPDGRRLGSGIGSCSTLEAKYISRPRDMENTIIKMAQKRAFVAATLTTFGLSNAFTQDMEDIKENEKHYDYSTAPTPQAKPAQKNVNPNFDKENYEDVKNVHEFLKNAGIPNFRWGDLISIWHGKSKKDLVDQISKLKEELKNEAL